MEFDGLPLVRVHDLARDHEQGLRSQVAVLVRAIDDRCEVERLPVNRILSDLLKKDVHTLAHLRILLVAGTEVPGDLLHGHFRRELPSFDADEDRVVAILVLVQPLLGADEDDVRTCLRAPTTTSEHLDHPRLEQGLCRSVGGKNDRAHEGLDLVLRSVHDLPVDQEVGGLPQGGISPLFCEVVLYDQVDESHDPVFVHALAVAVEHLHEVAPLEVALSALGVCSQSFREEHLEVRVVVETECLCHEGSRAGSVQSTLVLVFVEISSSDPNEHGGPGIELGDLVVVDADDPQIAEHLPQDRHSDALVEVGILVGDNRIDSGPSALSGHVSGS